MLKVGDKVRLKQGQYSFAGVNPGEIGKVTKVLSEYTFQVNNQTGTAYLVYWDIVKETDKKQTLNEGWGF